MWTVADRPMAEEIVEELPAGAEDSKPHAPSSDGSMQALPLLDGFCLCFSLAVLKVTAFVNRRRSKWK